MSQLGPDDPLADDEERGVLHVRPLDDDGRCRRDDLRPADFRREAAHAARSVDPLARAEERKRWKAIHKSVAVHMRSKYGEAS